MKKKTIKRTSMALMCGTVLGIFGCGDGILGNLLYAAPAYLAMEFLLDSDATFDLFESGNVPE